MGIWCPKNKKSSILGMVGVGKIKLLAGQSLLWWNNLSSVPTDIKLKHNEGFVSPRIAVYESFVSCRKLMDRFIRMFTF